MKSRMTHFIKPINITVCADDYAQNSAISEGILSLAEKGRISATSCMVNSTCWRESSQALHPIQSRLYVGFHFNLTHGEPLSSSWKKNYGTQLPGMPWVLRQACLRRLKREIVAAELQAQLDAYAQAMNDWPDFIDGHQHIHQLPVIREVLLDGYASRMSDRPIRKTSQSWLDLFSRDGVPKRQLLALLGGVAFQKRLSQIKLPTNTSFSGIYNFNQAKNYRRFFQQFLKHSLDGGLIMCHPGNSSDDTSDPLQASRHDELDYFMSDEYLSDLASHSCQLTRKEV